MTSQNGGLKPTLWSWSDCGVDALFGFRIEQMQARDANADIDHLAGLRQNLRRDAHHDRLIVMTQIPKDLVAVRLDHFKARRNRSGIARRIARKHEIFGTQSDEDL